MLNKRKINQVLTSLSSEDKEAFLRELIDAVLISRKTGDLEQILECLHGWEATAELNAMPGVKSKVWERFQKLRKSGAIHA